jgi:hypothetical protein
MLQAALLLLALAGGQQPTQQPTVAPAKSQASMSQPADTSKSKPKHARKGKKGKAAPKDTTKTKP